MRYAFGPFEVDRSTLELWRDGEPVSVEPQVFELLVYLIENRDRVLSKDDLIEAVWGGRIVSDAAISSRIKLVRRAVDDDGTRQAVIKTVHGKGFRFVADLREAAVPAKPVPRAASTPAPPPAVERPLAPWHRYRGAMAGAAGLAVAAIALTVLWLGRTEAISDSRIAVLPVANETGDPTLDWAELGLMSLVIHDLESRSERPLVKPSAVMTLSERFESDAPGDLQPSPRLRSALAEGYGVSHILSAKLVGTADNLSLQYRMINPRGESAVASVSGQLAAELAAEMSRQVAATLPRSGERRSEPNTELFNDIYVAETYARGRDLQMKGLGEDAANLFRVAAGQDPDNLTIRYELAVSTRMAGDLDEAEAKFHALIQEAIDEEDPVIEAGAQNALGVVHMTRRDDQQAMAAFEAALTVLDTLDEPEKRAHALTNMGIIQRRLGEYEAAEESLGRALIEYEAASYETPPGNLLNSLAVLKVQTRDVPTANAYLEQALASFRVVGDKRAEAVILHNLGSNAKDMGDYEKSSTLLTDALAMRQEIDDARGQMSSHAAMAELAIARGDSASAASHSGALSTLAGETSDAFASARAEAVAAHVAYSTGAWEKSIAHSRSAQEGYGALERVRQANRERVRQAVTRGYAGLGADQTDVEAVLDWAHAEDQQGTALVCLEALTMLSVLGGDLGAASSHVDEAVALSADLKLNAVTGRLAARQGIIRLMQGDVTGASASLGRAKSGFAQHHETILLEGLVAMASEDADMAADRISKAKQVAGDTWHLSERLFQPLLEGI